MMKVGNHRVLRGGSHRVLKVGGRGVLRVGSHCVLRIRSRGVQRGGGRGVLRVGGQDARSHGKSKLMSVPSLGGTLQHWDSLGARWRPWDMASVGGHGCRLCWSGRPAEARTKWKLMTSAHGCRYGEQ